MPVQSSLCIYDGVLELGFSSNAALKQVPTPDFSTDCCSSISSSKGVVHSHSFWNIPDQLSGFR
ncbi:hypothetical protein ACSBR2_037228 [Camellia fascicularis]